MNFNSCWKHYCLQREGKTRLTRAEQNRYEQGLLPYQFVMEVHQQLGRKLQTKHHHDFRSWAEYVTTFFSYTEDDLLRLIMERRNYTGINSSMGLFGVLDYLRATKQSLAGPNQLPPSAPTTGTTPIDPDSDPQEVIFGIPRLRSVFNPPPNRLIGVDHASGPDRTVVSVQVENLEEFTEVRRQVSEYISGLRHNILPLPMRVNVRPFHSSEQMQITLSLLYALLRMDLFPRNPPEDSVEVRYPFQETPPVDNEHRNTIQRTLRSLIHSPEIQITERQVTSDAEIARYPVFCFRSSIIRSDWVIVGRLNYPNDIGQVELLLFNSPQESSDGSVTNLERIQTIRYPLDLSGDSTRLLRYLTDLIVDEERPETPGHDLD